MPSIAFLDDFDGSALDLEVWVPHYPPQWSSRAESAATYEVVGSEAQALIWEFDAPRMPLLAVDWVRGPA